LHHFEYHSPANTAEAIALLDRYGSSARVIAGGTDLITALKERWEKPAQVINLNAIPELRYIEYDPERGLRIGSGTTVRAVEISPIVRQFYPVIASAAATLASIQIRNLATVAGNICRASPSADMPPALLVLDAVVHLAGPLGERSLPLCEVFTGPGKTVIAANEILTKISIPAPAAQSGAAYLKHSPRVAMDLASIGAAAAVTMENGVCTQVRIALGAVAPTPLRVPAAEAVLSGQAPSLALLAQAAQAAAQAAKPIGDIRASADYRREMVAVLVQRALEQAITMAMRTAE
jgi:carbon-monoxide dehydrogenase medium subunit